MSTKAFKPILAPNDQPDLDSITYPIQASYKLDGIRCIFYKGAMLSRSLKSIVNKQLRKKFAPLIEYSKERQCIIDGEIYSPKLTFQEITKFCMTKDFTDPKTIKKEKGVLEIPDHLKFYVFDAVGSSFETPFEKRFFALALDMQQFPGLVQVVKHVWVNSKEELNQLFEKALSEGCEGLILRDPDGIYKQGRGTLKEGIIYKVKPFVTEDSKILEVIQATKVDPQAEKEINELGYSKTSRKKGDRILIEKAAAFLVDYKGKPLKVTIAMPDRDKIAIWKNRKEYIGKVLEYKFMQVGMKQEGLPRHPISIRIRYDKD